MPAIRLSDFASLVAVMRTLQRSPSILNPEVQEKKRRLEREVDSTLAEILRESPYEEGKRETLDSHTEMYG